MKINLPTKITISRIALIPFMIFAYLAESLFAHGILIAMIIFVVAAATDALDGHLARKRGEVTTLGKFLDPIADKLLAISALALIVADGTIPQPWGVIFFVIIIAREFAISGLRQIAMSKNVVIQADKSGKIKAVFQDVAIAAYMLLAYLVSVASVSQSSVFAIVCFVVMVITTLLTIFSGCNYFAKNKGVFVDGNE